MKRIIRWLNDIEPTVLWLFIVGICSLALAKLLQFIEKKKDNEKTTKLR